MIFVTFCVQDHEYDYDGTKVKLLNAQAVSQFSAENFQKMALVLILFLQQNNAKST